MSEQQLPVDAHSELATPNLAEQGIDPVADGAIAAQRVLVFSDKNGPTSPGERPDQHYSEPHEVQIRDDHISKLEAQLSEAQEVAAAAKLERDSYKNITNVLAEHTGVVEDAKRRDPLTGLLNRDGLAYYWGKRMARPSHPDPRRSDIGKTYMFGLDLDKFKELNDSEGHPAGDRALGVFAKILQDNLREDSIIARTGGDEFFAVALNIPDKEDALAIASRIGAAIKAGDYPISASIGVALVDVGGTLEENLKKADDAMYTAKNTGRDKVVMYEEPERP